MAARRLVMVLLVLLVVSTFAATLVPPPPEDEESTTTSQSTTASDDRGRLVNATVSADAGKVERVRVGPRDELELRVTSKQFNEVEIPRLGEWDEVDRFTPAVFDLIPDGPGTYPVRLAEGGRVIARIVTKRSQTRTGRETARPGG